MSETVRIDLPRKVVEQYLAAPHGGASFPVHDAMRGALANADAQCTTFDCDGQSVASVEIVGEWSRYCQECAETLERSGDPTRWDAPESSVPGEADRA